jgi:drug/metabolite transporter (DMT)-like permease
MTTSWSERAGLIAILAVAVLSQAVGNVFLSKGMKQIAADQFSTEQWGSLAVQAVHNPMILGGVALFIVFFVLFATAVSRADLSFVLPAISSEVILTVAFADYFLDEAVSPTRWMGAVLISVGIVLVLQSNPRTFGLAPGAQPVSGEPIR